jgi:hypothetical protein
MPPSPYRTSEAAIRADVEWKLAILTVPRRIAIGVELREELERLEVEAEADQPGAWPDLARVCELALAESAKKLAAPADRGTSLIRALDDAARFQLFVAVPAAIPDVAIGRVGETADDGFIAEGHAELARWLLDADLADALAALGDIDPRIAIGDGDAYISWFAAETASKSDPDPALQAVTRLLLAVRARLVVEGPTPPE